MRTLKSVLRLQWFKNTNLEVELMHHTEIKYILCLKIQMDKSVFLPHSYQCPPGPGGQQF